MGKTHHNGNKSTTLETSVLGNPYAVTEVKRDSLREPFVVCDVDKRRKCDSYYVTVNRELEKRINEAVTEINTLMAQFFYDKDFVVEYKDLYKVLSILEPNSRTKV